MQIKNLLLLGSTKVVKNGKTYYGKQRFKCHDCHRQFVANRTFKTLSNNEKSLIGDLLVDRISLEGICRVLKISAYHIYMYMDELYQEIPSDLYVSELLSASQNIDLQCFECENDEAWSFVGHKGNKQWIWMAMHRKSRLIVGLFIGERGTIGAQGLWDSIPKAISKNAIFHTDDWEAYKKVFIQNDHRPSKQKKEINHIERFWANLRQRCSRLVRLALSFSKKQQRHVGAIRYFIALYNLNLALLF